MNAEHWAIPDGCCLSTPLCPPTDEGFTSKHADDIEVEIVPQTRKRERHDDCTDGLVQRLGVIRTKQKNDDKNRMYRLKATQEQPAPT